MRHESIVFIHDTFLVSIYCIAIFLKSCDDSTQDCSYFLKSTTNGCHFNKLQIVLQIFCAFGREHLPSPNMAPSAQAGQQPLQRSPYLALNGIIPLRRQLLEF
ncbi:hypothetical protein MHIR_DE00629 [Candidatus Doolittlea endobia]|uniref:Uncharacterized protein n=1 Tax=Candidatus Doolittlea endobia TaxID=1778262 RepID=A0A143WSR1_9ENTR|nr:hypothetical protein MHIR_DE00629 [Candidatus Doolittlea endobia]